MMEQRSILEKKMLEPMLVTARQVLQREGFLIPILLVNASTEGPQLLALNMPPTPEQKQRYFREIGSHFSHTGQVLHAAVMLSESWYLNYEKAPAASRFRPSQHPCRQEAITILGQNADKSRVTQLIQPFARDPNNRPVWADIPIAIYNEPAKIAGKPIGLLDYLFLANRR